MEGPPAPGSGDISLHNFSVRLWEQLIHFHVMRLTDSLFLWVGATPNLRNLAVAMCNRYDSIPVSTSLLGDTSDTTSNCLAQRLELESLAETLETWNHEEMFETIQSNSRTYSEIMAKRARKTKKQVFVSYNLQNTDSNFTLLIENRIKEEMEAFPEKF